MLELQWRPSRADVSDCGAAAPKKPAITLFCPPMVAPPSLPSWQRLFVDLHELGSSFHFSSNEHLLGSYFQGGHTVRGDYGRGVYGCM